MATFRDGQEAQSGIIRRDPARLCGRRDGPRTGQEAWRASTNGAPGNRERDPARAKEARTEAAEGGSVEGCHRGDAGGGSAGAAEAAAHGASDLCTVAGRAPGVSDRRGDRAAVRAETETGAGGTGGVRATELRLGPGGSGRLVRSGGETGGGAVQAAVLRDAQHGVGRRVSSGLHACYAASAIGGARAGLRLFRGRVPDPALRQ